MIRKIIHIDEELCNGCGACAAACHDCLLYTSIFLGKALYLFLMVFMAAELMKNAKPDAFVHIFFFLTITGGLLNTHIFNPTKDKYYAMILMRMDARCV